MPMGLRSGRWRDKTGEISHPRTFGRTPLPGWGWRLSGHDRQFTRLLLSLRLEALQQSSRWKSFQGDGTKENGLESEVSRTEV